MTTRRPARRAWPTDTYAQRWARLIDVACILYAPPIAISYAVKFILHVLHK